MKVCVLSSGSGYHAANFARLNGFDHIPLDHGEVDLDTYDVIWFIGYFIDDAIFAHRLPDVNVIVHFIGSDTGLVNPRVRDLMTQKARLNYPTDELMRLGMVEDLKRFKVLTVADHLSEELKEIEVESEVVLLIYSQLECASELGPNILCFSNPRRGLFKTNMMLDLAFENPDLSLIFYGAGEFSSVLENVKHVGWISEEEKKELYKECFCYCRGVVHDGMPQSLIECKQMGMNAIWLYDLPYVKQFDFIDGTTEELSRKIRLLKGVDAKGSKYFREKFSVEILKESVKKILDNF